MDINASKNYLQLYAQQLIDAGLAIIPCDPASKKPSIKNYLNAVSNIFDLAMWDSYGWFTDGHGIAINCKKSNIYAIDIDIDNIDTADFIRQKYFNDVPKRSRGNARFLAPFKFCNGEAPLARSLAFIRDGVTEKIEILNKVFMAYGTHTSGACEYEWGDDFWYLSLPQFNQKSLDEMLENILEDLILLGYEKGGNYKKQNLENIDGLSNVKGVLDISETEIKKTLRKLLDKGGDYHYWLKVGMALHHQFNGDELGKEIWAEYSENAPGFNEATPGLIDIKWGSFSNNFEVAQVTFSSLIFDAKENEEVEEIKKDEIKTVLDTIKNAKNTDELDAFMIDVFETTTKPLHKEIFSKAYIDKYKNLTGVKISLKSVKDTFLATVNTEEGEMVLGVNLDWCKDWVWVKNEDKFYNVETKESLTITGFNKVHGKRFVNLNETFKSSYDPVDVAMNGAQIPTVFNLMYWPENETVFNYEGLDYVNTYKQRKLLPKPAEEWTEKDKKAVEVVFGHHLSMLCADDLEKNLAMSWFAHKYKSPDKKMKFALLFQSAPRVGKTFFCDLFRVLMGDDNIRVTDVSEISNLNYSPWAANNCLVVVEEIKLTGHNRFDVVNALKPYITNDKTIIKEKYTKSYAVKNFSDYLLFTNYIDAIPIDELDGRFLVVKSKAQTVETRKQALEKAAKDAGLEATEYYDYLYGCIDKHAPALAQALIDWEYVEEFKPFGSSPATASKIEMVKDAGSEIDNALNEILEDKIEGLSPDHFKITQFVDTLKYSYGLAITPKRCATILKSKGFEGPFRARSDDGVQYRYWVK